MKAIFFIAVALLLMGAAAPQSQKSEHDCTLTVEAHDYVDRVEYKHWCHTSTETLEMKLPADYKPGSKRLQTGHKIKVRGNRVIENKLPVLYLDGADVQYLTIPVANPQFAIGPQRTLVMVVSFAGRFNQQDEAFFKTYYRNTVDYVLRETSYNTTYLTPIHNLKDVADVVDVTIPYVDGCDIFTITLQAQQAAQAKGYGAGADQYHRFSYHLPSPNCGNMRGIATVGWYGGYAVTVVTVQQDDDCEVTCHELNGHNIGGLMHTNSNTLNSPNCCFEEYGGNDFMGNRGGTLNPHQRMRAGWFNLPKTGFEQAITQSGDYQVESIALPAVGKLPKTLSIPTNDPNTNLYVALTTPDGYNARMLRPPSVSIYSGSAYVSTFLACTLAIKWTCDPGDTFSYLYSPIFVTVKSIVGTVATVNVTFTPPPPTSTPRFTVTK